MIFLLDPKFGSFGAVASHIWSVSCHRGLAGVGFDLAAAACFGAGHNPSEEGAWGMNWGGLGSLLCGGFLKWGHPNMDDSDRRYH